MTDNNPIDLFVSHLFDEDADYLRVFEFLESVDRFYYINDPRERLNAADFDFGNQAGWRLLRMSISPRLKHRKRSLCSRLILFRAKT